jgi:hypothetical protein
MGNIYRNVHLASHFLLTFTLLLVSSKHASMIFFLQAFELVLLQSHLSFLRAGNTAS